MTVREWLKETVSKEYQLRDHVTCKDGTVLSVQASSMHYCYPKMDSLDDYSSVEVSVVSGEELNEAMQYFNSGVYGFVPVGLLEEVVADRGGLVKEKKKKKAQNKALKE